MVSKSWLVTRLDFTELDRIQKIRVLRAILFFGTVGSYLFHTWWRLVRRHGFPRDTFFFTPVARYSDFFDIVRSAAKPSPYLDQTSVYFPFTFLEVFPFTLFDPLIALGVLFAIFFAFLIAFHTFWLRDARESALQYGISVGIFTIFSFPVLFALDRGNFELLLLIHIGVWFMAQEWLFRRADFRRLATVVSVIALGSAIAMKGYPGLLLLVNLAERRFKTMFATLALAGVLTFVGLATMGDGLALELARYQGNLLHFRHMYSVRHPGLGYGISLWGFVRVYFGKVLSLAPPGDTQLEKFSALILPYSGFATIVPIAFVSTVVALVRKLPRWQLFGLPIFSFILFTEVSFVYKLMHLIFPIALFLNAETKSPDDTRYVVLFGLLLIPKDYRYLIMHHNYPVSLATVIDPVLLLILITLVLSEVWKNARLVGPLKGEAAIP